MSDRTHGMKMTSRAIVVDCTHALLPDSYKMNMRINFFKDRFTWQEK
jgi:hypothetical protein